MYGNQTRDRDRAILFHKATSLDDPFLAHISYETHACEHLAIMDLIFNSSHPQLALS